MPGKAAAPCLTAAPAPVSHTNTFRESNFVPISGLSTAKAGRSEVTLRRVRAGSE